MHEQSKTIEKDGVFYNISGVTGAVLPAKYNFEKDSYQTEAEALNAAQQRSDKGSLDWTKIINSSSYQGLGKPAKEKVRDHFLQTNVLQMKGVTPENSEQVKQRFLESAPLDVPSKLATVGESVALGATKAIAAPLGFIAPQARKQELADTEARLQREAKLEQLPEWAQGLSQTAGELLAFGPVYKGAMTAVRSIEELVRLGSKDAAIVKPAETGFKQFSDAVKGPVPDGPLGKAGRDAVVGSTFMGGYEALNPDASMTEVAKAGAEGAALFGLTSVGISLFRGEFRELKTTLEKAGVDKADVEKLARDSVVSPNEAHPGVEVPPLPKGEVPTGLAKAQQQSQELNELISPQGEVDNSKLGWRVKLSLKDPTGGVKVVTVGANSKLAMQAVKDALEQGGRIDSLEGSAKARGLFKNRLAQEPIQVQPLPPSDVAVQPSAAPAYTVENVANDVKLLNGELPKPVKAKVLDTHNTTSPDEVSRIRLEAAAMGKQSTIITRPTGYTVATYSFKTPTLNRLISLLTRTSHAPAGSSGPGMIEGLTVSEYRELTQALGAEPKRIEHEVKTRLAEKKVPVEPTARAVKEQTRYVASKIIDQPAKLSQEEKLLAEAEAKLPVGQPAIEKVEKAVGEAGEAKLETQFVKAGLPSKAQVMDVMSKIIGAKAEVGLTPAEVGVLEGRRLKVERAKTSDELNGAISDALDTNIAGRTIVADLLRYVKSEPEVTVVTQPISRAEKSFTMPEEAMSVKAPVDREKPDGLWRASAAKTESTRTEGQWYLSAKNIANSQNQQVTRIKQADGSYEYTVYDAGLDYSQRMPAARDAYEWVVNKMRPITGAANDLGFRSWQDGKQWYFKADDGDEVHVFNNPREAKKFIGQFMASRVGPNVAKDHKFKLPDLSGANHVTPLEFGFWRGTIDRLVSPIHGWSQRVERETGLPIYTKIVEPLLSSKDKMKEFEDKHSELLYEAVKGVGGIRSAGDEMITRWLEAPAKGEIEKQMSPELIDTARKFREFYNKFFKEFGLSDDIFLQNYAPHMRKMGYRQAYLALRRPKELEAFFKYERVGEVDHRETSAILSAFRYLRVGAREKYMNDAWKTAQAEFEKMKPALAAETGTMGRLEHFFDDVYGKPDGMQRAIQEASRSLYGSVVKSWEKITGEKVSEVSKERMHEWIDSAEDFFQSSVYGATMAWRAGTAIRNGFQILITTLPRVRDIDAFFEGFERAFSKEGWQLAKDNIAEMSASRQPLGSYEKLGPQSYAKPTLQALHRFTEVGMTAYKATDDAWRAVSFHAQRVLVEKNLAKLQANKIDLGTFWERVGVDMFGPEIERQAITKFHAGDYDGLANYLGNHLQKETQFVYDRAAGSQLLRGTRGRLLGQFGTWPTWYFEFLRNLATRGTEANRAKSLAIFAGVNVGIYEAAYHMFGVDGAKWLFFAPLFYTGGPALQTLIDASQSLGRGPGGDIARWELLHNDLSAYVPGSGVFFDLKNYYEETDPNEKIRRLLGFKKATQPPSLLEQIPGEQTLEKAIATD